MPAELSTPVELRSVPFFAQVQYECGPASLAMVLAASGVPVTPDELTAQVYLPARQGSLQIEMLATARRRERVAVRLPSSVESLVRELRAGHPVLVLQNLGLSFVPRWHYAVLVGYDLGSREFILRSGLEAREVMGMSTFERTWTRGGGWAFVALKPGELPPTASEVEVTAAAVAFERVAPAPLAQLNYDAALARWPQSLTLAMGAGNTRVAQGALDDAAHVFAAAAQRHDSAPAWINLAELRLQLSDPAGSVEAARRGVAASERDPPWRAAAADTLLRALAAASSARTDR